MTHLFNSDLPWQARVLMTVPVAPTLRETYDTEVAAAARSVFGVALERGIHRPHPRAGGNPSGRNLTVCLECEVLEKKPVPVEDRISLLSYLAERANEAVPMQYRSRVILRAFSISGRSHSRKMKGSC
jgi:hypothetical protein